ncbi:MAG: methylated-DNA--[protein]-cysteine S-methyltransferase [Melioribacteraceae bacterium]|nr:methylated-DNA--[protein]-cysteine S-methyltransferase [Melioribacteraceae bacterium]MCF8412156.1 methylated-DNA--[protein]-cysteine S-methyltransferase [Melioribacteraceae bacterium]MCF8431836.1 methylated-DNA--[protein]-cysteine S-methyltransferase [Melioribacteraceae bacterium]
MENEYLGFLKCPLGLIEIKANKDSITSVLFVFDQYKNIAENTNGIINQCKKQLSEYFSGERKSFDLNIHQEGTPFQMRVWNELLEIPYGKTISYNHLAEALGDKKTIRAVGGANGRNLISIIVPCHRVIGSDGSLIGYAGGMWRKKWLLGHEKQFSGQEIQMELGL